MGGCIEGHPGVDAYVVGRNSLSTTTEEADVTSIRFDRLMQNEEKRNGIRSI